MGALSLFARKNAKAQRAQWSSRLWSHRRVARGQTTAPHDLPTERECSDSFGQQSDSLTQPVD